MSSALAHFRVPNAQGAEYLPFSAEVWNTAIALRAAMRAGWSPQEPRVQRAIDWLMALQTDEAAPRMWQRPASGAPRYGGWSFEADNERNPDCDTTGAVLHVLAEVLQHHELPTVRAAVEEGVQWLLPMQNAGRARGAQRAEGAPDTCRHPLPLHQPARLAGAQRGRADQPGGPGRDSVDLLSGGAGCAGDPGRFPERPGAGLVQAESAPVLSNILTLHGFLLQRDDPDMSALEGG